MANLISVLLILIVTAWHFHSTGAKGLGVGLAALKFNLGHRHASNKNVVVDSNLTINIRIPGCQAEGPTHEHPCDPNPCKNGGVCTEIYDNTDYKCSCKFPTGGPTCEDLDCKTTCYRLNDVVYFLFPYTPSNFLESYDKCVKEGLTMAMLKDKPTHEYIRSELLKLWSNRPNAKHSYWIGLNRTSTTDPWKWVDGTELQYNDGWAPERPGVNLCCTLSNNLFFQFKFDDDPCTNAENWTYFPMCQMTYPFLLEH